MEMASTLDSWYTITDNYLLRFSSLILPLCVVCAVRACVSYLCIIFFEIVMSVMYVKINFIIVRQEIEINSD